MLGKCTVCNHSKKDHSSELGCARCTSGSKHQFLSNEAAETMIAEHPDLLAPGEFGLVPAHIELQARLMALQTALQAYDMVTNVFDEPIPAEFIEDKAKVYIDLLLKREYS